MFLFYAHGIGNKSVTMKSFHFFFVSNRFVNNRFRLSEFEEKDWECKEEEEIENSNQIIEE